LKELSQQPYSLLRASSCAPPVIPNVVIQWNHAFVQGVRAVLGPPMVARALAIVQTCMFSAWAACDRRPIGTQFGGQLRRPSAERRFANKNQATSSAAYRAAVDLFRWDKASVFDALMTNVATMSTIYLPTRARPHLECRMYGRARFPPSRWIKSTGDLTPTRVSYADYTGYESESLPKHRSCQKSLQTQRPKSLAAAQKW